MWKALKIRVLSKLAHLLQSGDQKIYTDCCPEPAYSIPEAAVIEESPMASSRIDIYFHLGHGHGSTPTPIEQKLDQLITQVAALQQTDTATAGDISDLKTAVTAENTLSNSIQTLVQGIAAQIQAAATDQAKLNAFADTLNQSSTELAAAVAANTPSALPNQ